MSLNPYAPVIDEAVSFPTGPNSPMPAALWCSIIPRTEGQSTSTRGRQYERDQNQTGTSTVTVQNTDGAFDATNTASPFYPQITPYRAHRRRAQLPATINLLTPEQATASGVQSAAANADPTPYNTIPVNVSTPSTLFTLRITGSAGATSAFYLSNVPASAPVGTVAVQIGGWSVQPGVAHSAQCRVSINTSTLSVQATIVWYNAVGAVISTITGSPVTVTTSGVLVTVSGTAPANAAGAYAQLVTDAVPSVTASLSSNQWQVEYAATPSAYTQPGTWYPMVTDFVQQWPQDWVDSGTYGTAKLQCVDAFGYLSQTTLRSSAYMEILALNPDWFYPLDEASGATLFYDLTNNRPPMPLLLSGSPASNACVPGTTLPNPTQAQGIGGPVIAFDNVNSFGPQALLNLGATTSTPGPPRTTAWTRIFAINVTSGANGLEIWGTFNITGAGVQTGYDLNISDFLIGQLFFDVDWGSGLSNAIYSPNPVNDGNWHLAAITMSADGKTIQMYLDGALVASATNTVDQRPQQCQLEYFGAQVNSPNNLDFGYNGNLAFVAQLPYVITSGEMTLLYSTFRYGGSGLGTATSASRYADNLRWAQWAGQSKIDNYPSATTLKYGPASELTASATDTGTDAVSFGQTIVDTENGNQYAAVDGAVVFKSRASRYNQTTPVVTFGEDPTNVGAEIPYSIAGFGLDPALLVTDASITQTSTNLVTRYIDSATVGGQTAIQRYGDVPLQRNVNTLDNYELADAAQFLVKTGQFPITRLKQLVVKPSAFTINGVPSTAAWLSLLALELGAVVQVNRRPPGAPLISFLGFVEQINWSFDDKLTATCTLQISPNVGYSFFAFNDPTFGAFGSYGFGY